MPRGAERDPLRRHRRIGRFSVVRRDKPGHVNQHLERGRLAREGTDLHEPPSLKRAVTSGQGAVRAAMRNPRLVLVLEPGALSQRVPYVPAPLIERVDIPGRSLRRDAALVQRNGRRFSIAGHTRESASDICSPTVAPRTCGRLRNCCARGNPIDTGKLRCNDAAGNADPVSIPRKLCGPDRKHRRQIDRRAYRERPPTQSQIPNICDVDARTSATPAAFVLHGDKMPAHGALVTALGKDSTVRRVAEQCQRQGHARVRCRRASAHYRSGPRLQVRRTALRPLCPLCCIGLASHNSFRARSRRLRRGGREVSLGHRRHECSRAVCRPWALRVTLSNPRLLPKRAAGASVQGCVYTESCRSNVTGGVHHGKEIQGW